MKRLSLIVGGCVLGAALLLTPWLGPGLVQPASTGSARASTDSAESSTGPKLIALKFHADWCGSCKAMGNVYEELQEKFDQQPVLWLVLDHTRSHHRTQSAFLAQALGLGEVGPKTVARPGSSCSSTPMEIACWASSRVSTGSSRWGRP
jgi:thiol:disulfide interchange protein